MIRKLFSLLLCTFALFLLMGAGVETSPSVVLLIEEENVLAEIANSALDTDGADTQSAVVAATAGISAFELADNLDSSLRIDGAFASADVQKTQQNGVTYVALAPMALALESNAQIGWDATSKIVTVYTEKLTLTAQVGEQYVVANGRYLYLPDGVQMVDDKVTVPLSLLTKAFDAALSWDAATSTVLVTRGNGGLLAGDEFYNQDDLFWLSRVIFAESGNQSLHGKMAVGNVVMNRVASPIFPGSVQQVLAQKNQFTTYRSGKLAQRTPNAGSVVAAKLVLDGGVVAETEGALYFDCSRNSWASRNKTCITVLGAHSFYR